MKRSEFMEILRRTLGSLSNSETEELFRDIESHFDECSGRGMSEEEACEQLGDPEALGKEFLSTVLDSRQAQEDDLARRLNRSEQNSESDPDHTVNDDLGRIISESIKNGMANADIGRTISEKVNAGISGMVNNLVSGMRFGKDHASDKSGNDAGYIEFIDLSDYDTTMECDDGSLDIELDNITEVTADLRNADIFVSQSPNGMTRVTVEEGNVREENKIVVAVKDSKLLITHKGRAQRGRWHGFDFGFSTQSFEVHIELGTDHEGFPGALLLKTTRGDIEIGGIRAADISASSASGDLNISDLCADQGMIKLNTASGDIEAIRLKSVKDIKISTASGDTTASDIEAAGTAHITAGSGDIEASHIRTGGKLISSTGSGDLTVSEVEAGIELNLTTGSGDIEVCANALGKVVLSSGAGDIDASVIGFSSLKASSGAGDISVKLPDGISSTIYTSTGIGDISVDLPAVRSSGSSRKKTFITGKGDIEIKLTSGCGDIDVR